MANLEVQNANSATITKVTPQLVVEPNKAMEAVRFYEKTFGAQLIRYNIFPRPEASSDGYQFYVCAEVMLGSSTFVISDYDHRVTVEEPPPLPPAKVCLRLECSSKLKASVAKAVSMGCEIVGAIAEDPCRPGVLVGKIKDRFGHFWQLSRSSGGVSDGGFMSKERMTVMVVGDEKNEHHFQNYRGTPKVVGSSSCQPNQLLDKGKDAFHHRQNQDFKLNPVVVLDLAVDGVAQIIKKLREDMNFRGAIVGVQAEDDRTAVRVLSEFEDAGGDFMMAKPLNYGKVGYALVNILRREKKKEAAMKKKQMEESMEKDEAEKKNKEAVKMS